MMKTNESVLSFHHNQQTIKKALKDRELMVGQLRKGMGKENSYLSMEELNRITKHCNKYTKINNLVQQIVKGSRAVRSSGVKITGHEQFWKDNEKIEKELEDHLRELKEIDITIDNIVNEQFDKCNQIDQIEEMIRVILLRKQPNHIEKAQPYFLKKEKCLQFLKRKKIEKEQIKDHKLGLVKKIISLLQCLRNHRQAGLSYCVSSIDEKDQMDILHNAIYDIEQIVNNKEKIQVFKREESQLVAYMNDTQNQVEELSRQLFRILEDQTAILNELSTALKIRSENEHFQNMLLNALGLTFQDNLKVVTDKLQKYEHEQTEKDKQIIRIQQGIETTENTLKIFEHILDKIESQNSRRRQLLQGIQQMQNRHQIQSKGRQDLAQMESQLQKILLKKSKLEKSLEYKANEADVKAYKNIHSQIQELEKQSKKRSTQLEHQKKQINENSKLMYKETTALQDEFSDILSEVVPTVWLKENDFQSEDSIRDLNLYLLKTFKRLSIAD